MNIPLFKVFMSDEAPSKVINVLTSGFITQGPKVEDFENELATYIGNKNVLTVNSATSGLTLALQLLMKPNLDWPGFDKNKDIVLTPALTCFATTSSILACGANIKWIDTDNNTANISMIDLESKLTENTKIVFVVHWGGYPANLDLLKELQEKHYIKFGYRFQIIEDCAHAFGATYKGKKLGNHGNICVFSFQAIKHLTTGDGGAIVLPNKSLYDRAKLLRWFGIDREKRNFCRTDFRLENDILESGYKYHMNDINASIGLANLPYVDILLQKDRSNTNYLYQRLKDVKGVTLLEKDDESACWLFTIKVERKTEFISMMKLANITVSQVHNRNDINSCVKEYLSPLPNLDLLEKELICIPCGWWLTQENLEYIVEKIRGGW